VEDQLEIKYDGLTCTVWTVYD